MSERRGFGDFVDRLTSVAAIITAVAAVAIAVYEAHITRDFQQKSVWPYVMQYNSNVGPNNRPFYARSVENDGLGPALVHSFRIRVQDSAHSYVDDSTWVQVVRAFTGQDTTDYIVSGLGDGSVLKPGQRQELLRIPYPASAAKFFAHRSYLQTVICYCSLYGECWTANSDSLRPYRVPHCAASPK